MDNSNSNELDADFDDAFLGWDDSEHGKRPKINPSPLSTGDGLQSLPSFSVMGDALSDIGTTASNGGSALGGFPGAQLLPGTGTAYSPYALMPLTGSPSLQPTPAAVLPPLLRPKSAESALPDGNATTSTRRLQDATSTMGSLSSGGTTSNAATGATSSSSANNSNPATMAVASQHHHAHHSHQQGLASAAAADAPQLHPLGIQSSANCPQYVPAFNGLPGTMPYWFNTNTMGVQQPFMDSTTNPELAALIQQAMQQQQVLASMMSTAGPATAALNTSTMTSQQTLSTAQASSGAAKKPTDKPSPRTKASRKKNNSATLPPFHLFDAPVELRHNFMQTQRMYNLPPQEDNNSIHYGMAVNGFHPQLNAVENRVYPLSSNLSSFPAVDPSVRLVDGRFERSRAYKERNMREQKRAHKITELIDTLRSSMEEDGWKVEAKSKLQTLSTCADYVKHLVKTTKEKEEAIAKARLDLIQKEQKMEEDKALSESRSDPESVTSSLTSSSRDAEPRRRNNSASEAPATDDDKKRKAAKAKPDGSEDTPAKKARFKEPSDDVASSVESGDSRRPGFRNVSFNKMSSTMSDITDSNRGSSDGSGDKNNDECSANQSTSSISSTAVVVRGEGSHGKHGQGHGDVVFEKKRKRQHHREKKPAVDKRFDVDFEEVFLTSNIPQLIATPAGRIVTCNDFFLKATGLTKEEVSRLTIFSIVQADKLANLFEMVAEGLRTEPTSSRERETSTEAASSSGQTSSSAGGPSSEANSSSRAYREPGCEADSGSQGSGSPGFRTMTLPCISFPANEARKSVATTQHPNPLFMTVTLMPDVDPRKRCFHCMISDCPGTNGAMGFVTPELLSLLFAGN